VRQPGPDGLGHQGGFMRVCAGYEY
jgi:hypothetical protein